MDLHFVYHQRRALMMQLDKTEKRYRTVPFKIYPPLVPSRMAMTIVKLIVFKKIKKSLKSNFFKNAFIGAILGGHYH